MVKVITTTTSMMLYLFTAITTCRTAFGFSTITSRNGLLLSTSRTATTSRNGQAAFATITSPFCHSNHRQNHGGNSNGLLSSFHRTTVSSPTGTSLFMSSSASSNKNKKSKANNDDSNNNKVPITLLSGFLGSGKTTTLEHILHNNDGMKIGIVVNDVASVNIDAKLVSNKGNNGVIELQNGCACCSLADELLTSVDQLLSTKSNNKKNKKGDGNDGFDAVIVELSGVADPVAIQNNWNEAKRNGHPVTNKADVTQIVTLIDASTFGTDWMTWDMAGERDNWTVEGDDCTAQRKVPELLAEQVEAANVLLINKVDLADEQQVLIATNLAKEVNNNKATIIEQVSFGKTKTSPSELILRNLGKDKKKKDEEESHSHKHDHSHDENEATAAAAACDEPNCSDPTHDHSHSHHHHHDDEETASACSDPECNDPTHDHSHSHSHAATSTDQLGITSFVYKATRPFNLRKLLALLNEWPVPIKDELDLSLLKEAQEEGYEIQGEPIGTMDARIATSPFVGVLRSKGFCWFAPTKWSRDHPKQDVWRHDTAMYWSHAGKHFGISSAGKWWGSISKTQMLGYFKDNLDEYQRIITEDFVTDEFGDRRQEIVFIGVNVDEEGITSALNDCLVSEKGMDRYRQEYQNYQQSIFSSEVPGVGLFDVGGVDHMDLDR